MSVQTQLIDVDGTARELHWGWWHLNVLAEAMRTETPDEKYFPANGVYTFTQEWTFVDESDGEVLHIPIGTQYHAWR